MSRKSSSPLSYSVEEEREGKGNRSNNCIEKKNDKNVIDNQISVNNGNRNNARRGKKGQPHQHDGSLPDIKVGNTSPVGNLNTTSNNSKKQWLNKGKNRSRGGGGGGGGGGVGGDTISFENMTLSTDTQRAGMNNNNNNNGSNNRRQKQKKGNEHNSSIEPKSSSANANNNQSTKGLPKPSQKSKKKRKKKQNQKGNKAKNQAEEMQRKSAVTAAQELEREEEARKAAEEAALVEAQAKFEAEQSLLIQEKESQLQKFQDAINTCTILIEQTGKRQASREILLNPETLNELRKSHENKKKTLKSDIKKCTAFCRKVKMAGWDTNILSTGDYTIVRDIKTLNLSRYVEEVASAVMEAKLKIIDLPIVVALCTAMHERYEDFLPTLMPKLIAIIKSKDATSTSSSLSSSSSNGYQQQTASQQSTHHNNNVQTGDGDDGGNGNSSGGTFAAMDRAKEAARQRRICLKLLVEFVLNGAVGDAKLLLKIIADAAGASNTPSSPSSQQQQSFIVTDANLIISFAKAAGHELLGKPSRSIRNAIETLKNESEHILMSVEETKRKDENIDAQQKSEVETPPSEEFNSTSINRTSKDLHQSITLQQQPNKKIKEINDHLYDLAKKASSIPVESALKLKSISPAHSTTLRTYCLGAFYFFSNSFITTHTKLRKLEKRCEQDRLLVGSLSEAREKGLQDAKKILETLRNRVETLAEALDENLPVLNIDENEDSGAGAGAGSSENGDGVGLELWTGGQDSGGNGNGNTNLGPFDDEDAKSFYCDLPDLLTTIPPALLGLTQADVERIQAENLQKYGGIMEEDEVVPEASGVSESNVGDEIDLGKVIEENTEDAAGKKDDNDGSSDKDTPHYKLQILLDQELPECNRRESTDLLAEKFCNNHGASKSSRRRLSKALFLVPRTRLDLLPYYARVAAILHRVYPADIGLPLVQELEAQFHGLSRWKKNQNLEGRVKNARFIGELTKFRTAPPIVSLRCLKRCLDDFTGYNIDVACCLLESCGRYLYRLKHTNSRMAIIMDTIMRIRKAKHLDDRSIALIDSAFFMITPPPSPIRKQSKILTPLEAYLEHLLTFRLKPKNDVVSFIAKQLQRLPWSDSQIDCGFMVCKYMLKACRKGRYMVVKAVADVAATLRRARPEISSRLIDAVLEELQRFMERPNFRDQQRVLVMARLLGELHNAALVPTSLIFEQLHHFINFNHEIPAALRAASEKQALKCNATRTESCSNEVNNHSLLLQQRDIIKVIPEDEELDEEINVTNEDKLPSLSQPSVVAVSLHSQFDPRVPSIIDASNSASRIKLVCTLMESIGSNIISTNNLSKLHHFLASFQRYLFTKSTLPTEVEFSILDLFDSLDSYLKQLDKKEVRSSANNKIMPNGFIRYNSWLDAHNATIKAEESEAQAEARAKARLLAVGGADDAAINAIDEEDKEELENSDVMSEDEEDIDDESDDSENPLETVSEDSIGGACDDSDVSLSDDQSEGESGSGSGSESGESEEDSDDSDDDSEIDDDEEEEEEDEATAQEMFMRQLEEEAFERELRKITMEAIEKGKIAARTGNGGKIADNMVHASHFVGKKNDNAGGSGGDLTNIAKTALGGGDGVDFKLLKRGHKGRVEAKHIIVPTETNLARQATKQDDEAAREREALKARVLQYEVESAESQYSGNVYMDQTKLQVIRNRPLSMEDIDRNFGSSSGDYYHTNSSNRWASSSSERYRSYYGGGRGGGRGRGGRSLRFY